MRSLTIFVLVWAVIGKAQTALLPLSPFAIARFHEGPAGRDGDESPIASTSVQYPMIWPMIMSGFTFDPQGMMKTMERFHNKGLLSQFKKEPVRPFRPRSPISPLFYRSLLLEGGF